MHTDETSAASPRRGARNMMNEDSSGRPLETEPAAPDSGPGEKRPGEKEPWLSASRLPRIAGATLLILAALALAAFFGGRWWLRASARRNLPRLDGQLGVPGLRAAVVVERDAHGVPHVRAETVDDLVFAQAYVTAGDRLFQMDLLRRHSAGELAEVLGPSLVGLDRLQRTLQVRAAADRAVARLPAAQRHLLEAYAAGVNASIAAQTGRLPLEFRMLGYRPRPWTPRDSLLVELQMFQDLTTSFPVKLAREALTARLPPELAVDLYPVGSWRDHPPSAPVADLTIEGPPIEQVPLDETQSRMRGERPRPEVELPGELPEPMFVAGSNNWVVAGSHTASGKPLLSNDMHLSHTVPGIWYEADLQAGSGQAGEFHAAGVSIPGLPLIVAGHNAHIAWGFTNAGADVQDVYIEAVRGAGAEAEFRGADGVWRPVVHLPEVIRVRGGRDVTLDVTATRHGEAVTPILNPALTPGALAGRTLALRWTVYDPEVPRVPTYEVDAARDWPSFLVALSGGGLPAQNVVYADDQGHIGYHMVGSIPLRGAGPVAASSPAAALPVNIARAAPAVSSQTPTIAAAPDPLHGTGIQAPDLQPKLPMNGISPVPETPIPAREWAGYVPFAQLPQVFDPPGGLIATANARTTPDEYSYPITLNWAEPYRNERIWKTLGHRTGLTPGDMLALEDDVYSDFDHVLAQRLAYALDGELEQPGPRPLNAAQTRTLRQAADLLRNFNGRMTVDSPAAAVVASVHAVLWPMLLAPHVAGVKSAADLRALYVWGEEDYALEQVLMHTPARWLPKGFANWNEFLTRAIETGLTEARAPADLKTWRYGAIHVLEIEHPIFAQSPLLERVFGLPTGTGAVPQSGDGTTVKQVGRSLGPSERMTVDLADLDRTTLNVVLGQSGNPVSPWFMDQFAAWYRGSTFAMPFGKVSGGHRLMLVPG